MANGEFRNLLSILDVGIQPELKRILDRIADQAHGIATIEPFLDLTLKLGIKNLGRQNETDPCKAVFRQKAHALGQQTVQIYKALDRLEETITQTSFMRTSCGGGDEIDIRFPYQRPFGGPAHHPMRALTRGIVRIPFSGH